MRPSAASPGGDHRRRRARQQSHRASSQRRRRGRPRPSAPRLRARPHSARHRTTRVLRASARAMARSRGLSHRGAQGGDRPMGGEEPADAGRRAGDCEVPHCAHRGRRGAPRGGGRRERLHGGQVTALSAGARRRGRADRRRAAIARIRARDEDAAARSWPVPTHRAAREQAPAEPPPLSVPGSPASTTTLDVHEAQAEKAPQAIPVTTSHRRRALKWVAWGLGAAALGVGIYGAIANSNGVSAFDNYPCEIKPGDIAVDPKTGDTFYDVRRSGV